MASVNDVTRFLLQLAEDDGELVTEMRLHKLLYYIQGWSLGLRGREIFNEHVSAWVHGPVVKTIRKRCPKNKLQHVDKNLFPEVGSLAVEDQKFITNIWHQYRGFSAWALRNMTHREQPWVKAREGFSPQVPSDVQISFDEMKQFFKGESEHGIDPLRVWQGEQEADSGQVYSLEEVKKRILERSA